MPRRYRSCLPLLLTATTLAAPGAAAAQSTPREAELEARLARLETEMQALRADLASARVEPAQPAQPADGFRSGATTIKLGGFIKLVATNSRFSDGEVATNSLGRDFYLPQSIPTGGAPASRVQDFSAKQSRFWLNLSTDVAGHAVKGYVETDFQTSPGTQGSQRTTNGYNLTLRRAYIQVDKFTFGQDWSTFQYVGALPESTDFVGATEGTIFVRQPLIRYSAPLAEGLTLHAAIENAEAGTATLGAPALVENGDDRLPDFAARLAYAGPFGEVSLAGLAREVRVDNGGAAAKAFGWGASVAGKINLASDKSSDLRFDLPPRKWSILRVREPAIYGLKGAAEWHGRDTRQNRLSGCCVRPKFGSRKERRSARSAGRWGSRSRAIIAGDVSMAG